MKLTLKHNHFQLAILRHEAQKNIFKILKKTSYNILREILNNLPGIEKLGKIRVKFIHLAINQCCHFKIIYFSD